MKSLDRRQGRVGTPPAGGWDSWESVPWHNYSQAVENKPTQRPDASTAMRVDTQDAWTATLSGDNCLVCNNLDPRGHFLSSVETISNSVISRLELHNIDDMFRAVSSSRCGYCALIYSVFQKFHPRWALSAIMDDSFSRLPKLQAITLLENQPVLLTVEAWPNSKRTLHGIEIYRDPDSIIPSLPMIGAVAPISGRSDSDTCFTFVKQCIDSCVMDHTQCSSPVTELPTRVVDLGLRTIGNTVTRIKLLETKKEKKCEDKDSGRSSQHGQFGRYAALSHCWGCGNIPKTLEKGFYEGSPTEGNIDEMKLGIPIKSLSETFKDAIKVCNELEIQYLWIDSLCIVQNNVDDWETEAAKMGDIYRNAYVTIAAVSSDSGNIPFLRQRTPKSQIESFRFWGPRKRSIFTKAFRSSSLTPEILKAQRTSRAAAELKLSSPSSAVDGSTVSIVSGPLATRGWCLQERALSRRVIHFTDEGIKFECRTSFRSEDSRTCLPSYLSKWTDLEARIYDADFRWRLQCFWRKLLIDYTARQLTFKKDLLPALAGIAKRMEGMHRSPYIAGLWKDRFIDDLCWQPAENPSQDTALDHLDGVVVPTWSWISIQRPLKYAIIDEPGTFIPYTSVVSYSYVASNQFRDIPTAPLILKAPLLHGKMKSTGYPSSCIVSAGKSSATFKIDHYLVEWIYERDSTHPIETVVKAEPVRRATLDDEKYWTDLDVVCIYIARWEQHRQSWLGNQASDEPPVNFVMVLAPSSRVKGAFERVGMVNSFDFDSIDTWRTAKVVEISIV